MDANLNKFGLIQSLREGELLKPCSRFICLNCQSPLLIEYINRNKIDGLKWKCSKCASVRSIRTSSYFESLRLNLDIVKYTINKFLHQESEKKFRTITS